MTAGGLSKGQRRIGAILQAVPNAREQLLVAMEGFGPAFEEAPFLAAASSSDAHERNRVAVVERQYEVLLNWLHELAERGLAEGQRLGVVDKSQGHPWEGLAALGVISHESAARLQKARELCHILGHAYPPTNWKTLHEGVLVLVDELDRYLGSFERWAYDEEILPSV
ncbi:MAG TPA: hypothetical protein VNY52_04290 [Solirubrobacteraceae bacterium]|nr:hypothetical protein [Solirubrobacteraceae bacterium]